MSIRNCAMKYTTWIDPIDRSFHRVDLSKDVDRSGLGVDSRTTESRRILEPNEAGKADSSIFDFIYVFCLQFKRKETRWDTQ